MPIELIFAIVLLAPWAVSATQQKGVPLRTVLLNFPAALVVGTAIAFALQNWHIVAAAICGALGYYAAFYLLDVPFRNAVKGWLPFGKSRK